MLAPGWDTKSSWGNCAGTPIVVAGAIEADMACTSSANGAGLAIADLSSNGDSVPAGAYKTLSLAVQARDVSVLDTLSVSLRGAGNWTSSGAVGLANLIDSPVADQFATVAVDLDQLAAGHAFSEIAIVYSAANGNGPIFSVKDIVLSQAVTGPASTNPRCRINGGAASVNVRIDAGQTAPVSSYIYGINGFGDFVSRQTRFGLIRAGGDNFTTWGWTNDYHNAGADYLLRAISIRADTGWRSRFVPYGDTLPTAQAKGEAFLVTVPVVDAVAAAQPKQHGLSRGHLSGHRERVWCAGGRQRRRLGSLRRRSD